MTTTQTAQAPETNTPETVTKNCPICQSAITLKPDSCCPAEWVESLKLLTVCNRCHDLHQLHHKATAYLNFAVYRLCAYHDAFKSWHEANEITAKPNQPSQATFDALHAGVSYFEKFAAMKFHGATAPLNLSAKIQQFPHDVKSILGAYLSACRANMIETQRQHTTR